MLDSCCCSCFWCLTNVEKFVLSCTIIFSVYHEMLVNNESILKTLDLKKRSTKIEFHVRLWPQNHFESLHDSLELALRKYIAFVVINCLKGITLSNNELPDQITPTKGTNILSTDRHIFSILNPKKFFSIRSMT